MPKSIKISPSLLSANFARLESDIAECDKGGTDIFHADIMDGHFVPNITFGPLVVSAVNKSTDTTISCHLMIEHPEKYIEDFVKSGADYVSIHAEGSVHTHRTLSLIKSHGAKAGLALNPATPLEFAFSAAEYCDFILLMSVNPGFGGQAFIPSFLRRCDQLKNYLTKNGLDEVEIEVDGGVKIENAKEIVSAGADILVCGSGIFSGNIIDNIHNLRSNAEKGINIR